MTDSVQSEQDNADKSLSANAVLMSDDDIATCLDEYADLLQAQSGDFYRVEAYKKAAATVRSTVRSLADIYAENGKAGLIALAGIGESISCAITEMLCTGHWAQLQALNGTQDPVRLFETIPGIGPVLAERLVHDYHIETLLELNDAIKKSEIHLDGIGDGRKELISAVISNRIQYQTSGRNKSTTPQPKYAMLLSVDLKYRKMAENGELDTVSPSRHNPQNESWLPIMHETIDDWHFTALYSNTARAHRLGKTRDWVVIHFQKNGFEHGQCTVITQSSNGYEDLRVVKGL